MTDKDDLVRQIVTKLGADLDVLTGAAKKSHEAATHEECQPDNKYDTTALEASYLAQGQANRARDIRVALDCYRNIVLKAFDDDSPVRLTALVTVERDDGAVKKLFLGPYAGGLILAAAGETVTVITPASPLGRSLLGRQAGDEIRCSEEGAALSGTIISVR